MRKQANPLARDLDRLITAGAALREAQRRYDRLQTSTNRQKKMQAEKSFDTALALAIGSKKPVPVYLSIKPIELWSRK